MLSRKVSTNKLNPLLSSIFACIVEGYYKIGIQELKDYVSSNEATPQIYCALAYCYRNLDKQHKAIEFAEKALVLDPKYKKAILMIKELKGNPGDVDVQDYLEYIREQHDEDSYYEESEVEYLQRLHNINLDQIRRDYFLPSEPSLTPDPENGLFEGENLEEDWLG